MSKESKKQLEIGARIAAATRAEWLDEHPEASMKGYGHGQGEMAQLEVILVEGIINKKGYTKLKEELIKKYGVEIERLPSGVKVAEGSTEEHLDFIAKRSKRFVNHER